jgi:hypothetical protein
VSNVFERTKNLNMDSEERSVIPSTIEGLCQIYHQNMPVLVDLYIKHFSGFFKHQIEIGKPVEKKPEK